MRREQVIKRLVNTCLVCEGENAQEKVEQYKRKLNTLSDSKLEKLYDNRFGKEIKIK